MICKKCCTKREHCEKQTCECTEKEVSDICKICCTTFPPETTTPETPEPAPSLLPTLWKETIEEGKNIYINGKDIKLCNGICTVPEMGETGYISKMDGSTEKVMGITEMTEGSEITWQIKNTARDFKKMQMWKRSVNNPTGQFTLKNEESDLALQAVIQGKLTNGPVPVTPEATPTPPTPATPSTTISISGAKPIMKSIFGIVAPFLLYFVNLTLI